MSSDQVRAVSVGTAARIILPGTWTRVPLGDEEVTRRHVKALVKDRVGAADRLARTRREAMNEIVASARDAQALGAHTYLVSLELMPGLPFAAAMIVADERWPASAGGAPGADDVPDALLGMIPGGVLVQRASRPTVRALEVVRGEVGETEYRALRLDYVLAAPAAEHVLHVRVNVPNVRDIALFVRLFDEIVDSLRFDESE